MIIAFVMISCNTLHSRIIQATKEKKIYFLEGFHNDRLIIYSNKRKIIDTLIKNYNFTGEAYSVKLNGKKIRIQLNEHTTFYLNEIDTSYNSFVFNKFNGQYQLIKAKDTLMASW